MLLFVTPLVGALEECQRVQNPTDIPCTIRSSWLPSTGCSETFYIFNETGGNIYNLSWAASPPFCNVTWNYTDQATYIYNSSIEAGVITVASTDFFIMGILLIPIILAFFFVYYSNHFKEEYPAIGWLFKLLALAMIPILFIGVHIALEANATYSGLTALFDIVILSYVMYGVFALILIYILYNIYKDFKVGKQNSFDRGEL